MRWSQFLSDNRLRTIVREVGFFFKSPSAFNLLRKIRANKLSYLEMTALIDLYEAVRLAESQQIPGALLEAGTALGGSAIAIAAAKRVERSLLIFDAFETIPPPSVRDGSDAHERYAVISSGQATGINGDLYYGYQPNLMERVIENFFQFGYPPSLHHIQLIKGYYADTLQLNQTVALAHIDCDWYDSVMICLERIVPLLPAGGRLIIDDYMCWSGCRSAVDDYFRDRKKEFEFVMKSRLHILRR